MDSIPNSILLAVRSRYFSALEGLPPPLYDLGTRVMERVAPSQWTLEWALPYWLGGALRLSSDVSLRLTVCNVFGLAYVRLMDDLIDGEADEAARPASLLLAHQLYQAAILNYVDLFHERPEFWRYLQSWMDEWLAATLPGNQAQPKPLSAYQERDYLLLARRGAPLKICCAAGCLLAERSDAIPSLTRALDYALVALVLLDHFQDWADDLEAGRYNTFVAYASEPGPTPQDREAKRLQVLEALYLSDGGRQYLDQVRKYLRRAREVELAVAIPRFAEYLVSLESRANDYYSSLIERYRSAARGLAEEIFGPFEPIGPPAAAGEGGLLS